MDTALKYIHKFNQIILNPVIYLMFGVALVVFIYGVFQYATQGANSDAREEGTRNILWGIVGMFIMMSVFAIINIITGTFGFSNASVQQIIP